MQNRKRSRGSVESSCWKVVEISIEVSLHLAENGQTRKPKSRKRFWIVVIVVVITAKDICLMRKVSSTRESLSLYLALLQ